MKRVYFVAICLGISIGSMAGGAGLAKTEPPSRLTPKEAERVISVQAGEVLKALKSGNLARLSKSVHPTRGVRFSPYHYVNLGKRGDLVFTRSQVKTLLSSRRRYHWGDDDASGDPIRLTFAAYRRRFISDHDYSKAKDVTYNSDNLSTGNLVNNIWASYPAAIVVEYHFPGFEEKYGGMDWNSLWLIFEKQGTEWFLVGVAHGEWTI